jgi:hypothetical protein
LKIISAESVISNLKGAKLGICRYSTRQLTLSPEKLPALAGIAQQLDSVGMDGTLLGFGKTSSLLHCYGKQSQWRMRLISFASGSQVIAGLRGPGFHSTAWPRRRLVGGCSGADVCTMKERWFKAKTRLSTLELHEVCQVSNTLLTNAARTPPITVHIEENEGKKALEIDKQPQKEIHTYGNGSKQ